MQYKSLLLCFVGPAAGGKTSIANELVTRHPQLKLSVSLTSRPLRPGEREGVSYHFVTREEFEAQVARGELFEWEEVHGNLYGTRRSVVEEALAKGGDMLLPIDIRGSLNLKKLFPQNTVIVFLVPPSFAELKKRLITRASISKEEMARRFDTASQEYATLLARRDDVDYFVVNDRLDESIALADAIYRAESVRLSRWDERVICRVCRVEK